MHLYKKNRTLADYGIVISIVLFLVVMVYFFSAISGVSKNVEGQQKKALTAAIESAIVSCYAIEGNYPSDIEYLEKHYGIVYDHDSYYIELSGFGSNVRPAVNIISISDGGAE